MPRLLDLTRSFLPRTFFFNFALSLKVFSKKLNTIRSHKDLKIRITVLDFVIYTLRFFNFGNHRDGSSGRSAW